MSDDSMIKIMQSLGLDYNPAINSTLQFQKTIGGLNKQLADMKLLAMQGARDINNAFSSQLGNINNRGITDQWGMPIRTIREEAQAAHQPINELNNTLQNAGNTVENTGNRFTSNAVKFYTFVRAGKQATQTIKDVEMGMIAIQRVMEDSSFVFEDYRDNLFKLGVDYGQTFDNVQNIALRWAQSGYDVAESLELTKTSLLALNTAELDSKNATESMIGIMAQWELKAIDLALVMDKINITADNYSVTSQDLVDGLLRSSSAAKNMNMTLDETIGLLTVMREASGRTGKEVGSALNSILSYVTRPKSIDVLEDMGIKMFTDGTKSQFRNALEIFKDISASWGSLSQEIQDGFVKSADDAGLFNEELATAIGIQEQWNDVQQRDVSQASAGVYRRNYFIGMIERMSNVQGVLNGMMDAGGYSITENAKSMESLEKKHQSLKTSVEALAVAIGDAGLTDTLKLLVDGGTEAIAAFDKLDDNSKNLILSFGTMFALMKAGQIGLKMFGINMAGVGDAIQNAIFSATGFVASTNLIMIAIAGLTAVAITLYNHQKKLNEERKKAIETSSQAVKSYQDEITQLRELSSEYDSIIGNVNRTVEEKERLVEIQKELASTFPELTTGFDDEGNAMNLNADATRGLIAAKEKLLQQELMALSVLAVNRLPELKKSIKDTEDRINELTEKLRSGDTKETIWLSHKDGIKETRDMAEEYAKEVVELTSDLRDMKDEMSSIDKIMDDYQGTMIITSGNLEEARKHFKMLDEVQLQNLSTVEKLDSASRKTTRSRLENDRELTRQLIENAKSRVGTMQSEMIAMMALTGGKTEGVSVMDRMYSQSELSSANTIDRLAMMAKNKAIKAKMELLDLEINAKSIDDALRNLNNMEVSKGDKTSDLSNDSNAGSNKKTGNKQLDEALKLLEHRKKISEETQASIKAEIAELNRLNSLYAKTDDERMNMAERIYSAEKRYLSKRLQDSTNWINEKKNLNELSVEDEIAAWERVKNNQSDNIEAVKQATVNLHKLRNQLTLESFNKEENTIKHLTKLGVLSAKEQINAYKKLYENKSTSLDDERSRVENLFGLYKNLLKEQQSTIKDAYDDRIKQIESESKAKKDAQDDIIKGIEKELELLNLQENEYDHDKKMGDLKEQLAYWQVRTSEDARKKVAELLKQIDEAEHKREVELKKQSLEDTKKIAQDEIKTIEDAAKEEREKWEKSYKLTEKAFDEHSSNIVALAATMSKEAYQEWLDNYIIPMQNALSSGDYGGFNSYADGLQGSIDNLPTYGNGMAIHDWGMSDADYNKFIANGDRWKQLKMQNGGAGLDTEMRKLNDENNMLRMKYGRNPDLGEYPEFHQGAKTMSYGMAMFKPGELVFPPGLSAGIERLFPLLSNLGKSSGTTSGSLTDNRREIKIENLVKVENMHMEDDVDERSFARELQRELAKMV